MTTRDVLKRILNIIGHLAGMSLVVFTLYICRDGETYRAHIKQLETDSTYIKYRQHEAIQIVLEK